jgi:hypothetical protein
VNKGILLVALGHPYYAHMAFNLAVGLKYQNPDIPICLAGKNGSLDQLTDEQRKLFKIKEIKDSEVKGKYGYDPYKFKLHLNKISPFEKTLFLDVDMIWSPTKYPIDLFNELDGKKVVTINRGELKCTEGKLKSGWVDLNEVKDIYGLETVYDISSELIYFEKGEESDKFFEVAQKVYNDNKMNVMNFGDGKPDEAYLMVSLGINKIKLNKFMPTYWQPYYFTKLHNREFMQSHYAISVGGAFIQTHVKKIYDSIADHYFNRMGIGKAPYQLIPKSRILKERKKI